MSALYVMKFAERPDCCVGAFYIGRGVIVGIDVTGIRYSGTCETVSEGLRFTAEMVAPTGGAVLSTGQLFPTGETISLTGTLPNDFFDETPFEVMVSGRPVTVILGKVGDVP